LKFEILGGEGEHHEADTPQHGDLVGSVITCAGAKAPLDHALGEFHNGERDAGRQGFLPRRGWESGMGRD
jgi:hypothetical protein